MPKENAQRTNLRSHHHWALGIFLLGIGGCQSCKKPDTNLDPAQGECRLVDDQSLAIFKPQIPGCSPTKSNNAPNLYAHFFEQTLHQEICFADVIYDKSGALTCAPGPFLIENGSVIDLAENAWKLSSTPDYFVWHLENRHSLDESFYITNQQGFPLKSQSLRLQNEKDSTIVLLPKAPLLPGAKYYIYLVKKAAQKNYKWVQPIVTAAQSIKAKEQ
ncbi:MAG TPA: hypothetical protein VEL47_05830 [Myxococcota bacterium]|nr:hypothetical protein [Myxococcota bacterium]